MTRVRLRWFMVLAVLVPGCQGLDRFDTKPGESYCGALVSAPVFHAGLVPTGAPPSLRLRLELDTGKLTTAPGMLTSDDAERGLCAPRALFEGAPMRAIPELTHDALSFMEFGEGRDHNYMTWVDSSCQGTMLAVVSLMRDDSVEVRLLKPAPLPGADAGPDSRPGFGLFVLRRRTTESCSF
jgi:hypothetical protein